MNNHYQTNQMPQNGAPMSGIPPYPPQNGAPMNGIPPYPPQNGAPMNGIPPYPPQNGAPMYGMPMKPPAPRTSVGRTIAIILGTTVGYFVMQIVGTLLVQLFAKDGSEYMQQFFGVIPLFIFLVAMIVFVMKKKKVLTSKGNGFWRGLVTGGLMIYAAVSSVLSMFLTVDENGT